MRAYELHTASLKVKSLLETDADVKSNPSLAEHFEKSILKFKENHKIFCTFQWICLSRGNCVSWNLSST